MIFDRTSNSGVVKNPVYDRGRWYTYKIDEEQSGDTPYYYTFVNGLNMLVLPSNMTVLDVKIDFKRQDIEGVGTNTGCVYGEIGYTTESGLQRSFPAVSLPDPDHMEAITVHVFGYCDGAPSEEFSPLEHMPEFAPIKSTGGGGEGGAFIVHATNPDFQQGTVSVDKTAQEIFDAMEGGALPVVLFGDPGFTYVMPLTYYQTDILNFDSRVELATVNASTVSITTYRIVIEDGVDASVSAIRYELALSAGGQ